MRVNHLFVLMTFSALSLSAPVLNPSVSGAAPLPFVHTPDGLYPASCVQDVGNGSRVNASGHVLFADGRHALLPKCAAGDRHVPSDPRDYTPPSSWVMDSIWQSPVPAVRMTSTFVVPSKPDSWNFQTVYFFPGMRPADGSSVLQPVLQWGEGAGLGRSGAGHAPQLAEVPAPIVAW